MIKQFYERAKGNRWYHYFAILCRILLALAFIISGWVKISGERFASGLTVNNPMGHYLEALHQTEFYYTFIGIAQWGIAILLLIPRTALLGALLYFPVILNICVLAHAVRFEGTRITTFMVLANLFLLVWDYDRLKVLFSSLVKPVHRKERLANDGKSNQFPFFFFGSVFTMLAAVVILNLFLFDIRPGNSPEECFNGCPDNKNPEACERFCDCIYNQGKTLDTCLKEYKRLVKTSG